MYNPMCVSDFLAAAAFKTIANCEDELMSDTQHVIRVQYVCVHFVGTCECCVAVCECCVNICECCVRMNIEFVCFRSLELVTLTMELGDVKHIH